MKLLSEVLGVLMKWCFAVTGSYGLSIIAFTFLSKVVLLPVSIWLQRESIKMVRMQPEINRIKAAHFGDNDRIYEEQAKIFKREHYSPFVSVVPIVLQVVLLLGVVAVINHPETWYAPAAAGGGMPDQLFCGFNLGWIPIKTGGKALIVPIVAAASSWLMCFVQNRSNVLQAEQAKWNQYGTMIFSVLLSLYLGFFVQVAVALYWIASNLFSILQLYALNMAINPKKHVDYKELEESRKALAELNMQDGEKKRSFFDPLSRRERADYKRFFSVVNKHLVFYSENTGYYKYMGGVLEYILKHSDLTVHYITSDPDDAIFDRARQWDGRLQTYYIGFNKLMVLMMRLDTDLAVMTMPDLELFHIKRSIFRKDIEYIHLPHELTSRNLMNRFGSLDHYDTIFCVGKHQKEEILQSEQLYGLPTKRIVEFGYPMLDEMRISYEELRSGDKGGSSQAKILIAPSWQPDNIIDTCLEEMLDSLTGKGWQITVRPHPQQVRHQPERMEALSSRYAANGDIEIQTDFSSNSTIFESDLLITDWSSIAFEYAFTTYQPVLFVDTPMKVMNPRWEELKEVPMDIWARDRIGRRIEPSEAANTAEVAARMLKDKDVLRVQIKAIEDEYVYNPGRSAEVGGKYILRAVRDRMIGREGQ